MLGIAREDRRDVTVAFFTLVGVLISHSMLETARDALFLASVPASRLPWVYIAIAALTFAVISLNENALARSPKRRTLGVTLVIAAFVTGGFWFWARAETGVAALYAFYVWTGLVATLVISQFWILLGGRFSVAQAKRTFAIIGAGGLIGATAGSTLAGALLSFISAGELLIVAAGILLATSILPALLSKRVDRAPETRRRRTGRAPRSDVKAIARDPYLVRLLLLVLATTVTVTAADLTFKTVIADTIPASELGTFFAVFYAGLNGLALLVQLFFASRLLGAIGVNRVLLVLPAMLLVSAGAFVATVALLPVLLMKAFDGSLRHSLNRTGTELLWLPLAPEVRGKAKALIDGVGARGGQAIAAAGVLAAVALGADVLHLGIAVVVAGVVWLGATAGLKRHYLELFRRQLREGTIDTRMKLPDLDLHSFEALMAALNNPDENVVINALEYLERSDRQSVIPALILYHPAPEVVLRALEILHAAGRTDFAAITGRLVHSVDPRIRAAALRVHATIAPDEQLLRDSLEDPNADVRAIALVGLVASGFDTPADAADTVAGIVSGSCVASRLGLARAIRLYGTPAFDDALRQLGRATSERPLLAEVAEAVADRPNPTFLPLLLPMLEHRDTRGPARRALIAIGYPALDVLEDALGDTTLSPRLRRHIPRSISKFPQDRAVEILVSRLQRETDDRVNFKLLRGLGRMVADSPGLPLDHEVIVEIAEATLRKGIERRVWRGVVEREAAERPDRNTDGAQMLVALLREQEDNCLQCVFRLLGLLHPGEDFRMIYAGLIGDDEKGRSSALELIEATVRPRLRSAIVTFATTDDTRRSVIDSFGSLAPETDGYVPTLRSMLRVENDALRGMAAHLIGELGLAELRDDLESMQLEPTATIGDVVAETLRRLGNSSELASAH